MAYPNVNAGAVSPIAKRLVKGRLVKGRLVEGRLVKGRLVKGRFVEGRIVCPWILYVCDASQALGDFPTQTRCRKAAGFFIAPGTKRQRNGLVAETV